jgi:hypothetical protein
MDTKYIISYSRTLEAWVIYFRTSKTVGKDAVYTNSIISNNPAAFKPSKLRCYEAIKVARNLHTTAFNKANKKFYGYY